MRPAQWLSLIILILGTFTANARVSSEVRQPACYGNPSWPLKAIYLHGWFYKSRTDYNGFRSLEYQQRKNIEQLANRLHIRIAVPLGEVNRVGKYNWDGSSLRTIEAKAQRACGGQKLAPKMALIGFSNGGYRTRHILSDNCALSSRFTTVLTIGAPSKSGGINRGSQKFCRHSTMYVDNRHQILDSRHIATQLASFSGEDEEPRRHYADTDNSHDYDPYSSP